MKKKVFYYDDAVNDDFAGTNIKKSVVDEHFEYIRDGVLWKICAFIAYYIIAFPLVWFFQRVILGLRFENKDAVKLCRDAPYFLYGNHTGWWDAFTPNLISIPRRNRIIVSADTVSIKGLRSVVQMLGAVPLPTAFRGMRQFVKAVDHHHKRCNITIYPEAHIWPYYTGVRPFSDASFEYPVKNNAPVYAFFTAYSKPKGFLSIFRPANMTVYVSDPFYPDTSLSQKAARRDLRDRVYEFMVEKSQHSTYSVYEYIDKSKEKSDVTV